MIYLFIHSFMYLRLFLCHCVTGLPFESVTWYLQCYIGDICEILFFSTFVIVAVQHSTFEILVTFFNAKHADEGV